MAAHEHTFQISGTISASDASLREAVIRLGDESTKAPGRGPLEELDPSTCVGELIRLLLVRGADRELPDGVLTITHSHVSRPA